MMEKLYYTKENDICYKVYYNNTYIGMFLGETDGFFVFLPASTDGFWPEHLLEKILNALKDLNKGKFEELKEAYKNQDWTDKDDLPF